MIPVFLFMVRGCLFFVLLFTLVTFSSTIFWMTMTKCRDMVKKANALFCTFPNLSPSVLTYLLNMFCLSLYGAALWTLSSTSLCTLEVAFSKLLQRIWKLRSISHTGIVYCVSGLESIFNVVLRRSLRKFYIQN